MKVEDRNIQDAVCDAPNSQETGERGLALVKYLILGILFGIVFVKAEIISWFRIQECSVWTLSICMG